MKRVRSLDMQGGVAVGLVAAMTAATTGAALGAWPWDVALLAVGLAVGAALAGIAGALDERRADRETARRFMRDAGVAIALHAARQLTQAPRSPPRPPEGPRP